MPVLFLVIVEHEACNMGGNAARIEIKRMGSGLRDGFGPPASPWLAFPAPFRRRSMSRSGVTSRSALPHSGPSRLGGLQGSGNQRVHQSALSRILGQANRGPAQGWDA